MINIKDNVSFAHVKIPGDHGGGIHNLNENLGKETPSATVHHTSCSVGRDGPTGDVLRCVSWQRAAGTEWEFSLPQVTQPSRCPPSNLPTILSNSVLARHHLQAKQIVLCGRVPLLFQHKSGELTSTDMAVSGLLQAGKQWQALKQGTDPSSVGCLHKAGTGTRGRQLVGR